MSCTRSLNLYLRVCSSLFAYLIVWGSLSAQPRATTTKYAPPRTRVGASLDGLHTIKNDKVEVGIDLNYGGAMTYLAFRNDQGGKVSTRNMINNADLGRQVQIALYGGPLDYSKNGAQAWTGLGWDPIQAGDTYNNPSRVTAFEKQDNLLYVKCVPKQFALNNEDGEATIEHWIRLEGNVVKVHARVVLFRNDKTQYEARQQEMPCVYLNGEYHNMWYYKGNDPFTNASADVIRPVPPKERVPFGDVYPTEPWMASTNVNQYGVGLYVPNNYDWKKGYFGSDLDGDEYSQVASYIAATNFVLLDHNVVHEWDYALIVGHLNEIRSYVYAQPRPVAGPNYRFDTSRKGWYYYNTQDTGWPINGKLRVLLNNTPNNHIKSPFVFWKGREVPKMYIRAAFRNNESQDTKSPFRLSWRRPDDAALLRTDDRRMNFVVDNDGQYHTYEIDLSKNENWMSQNIGQIELQPAPDGPRVNGWLEIEWISTSPNGPVTETINSPVTEVIVPPVIPPPVKQPDNEAPVVPVVPVTPVAEAPKANECQPKCVTIVVTRIR